MARLSMLPIAGSSGAEPALFRLAELPSHAMAVGLFTGPSMTENFASDLEKSKAIRGKKKPISADRCRHGSMLFAAMRGGHRRMANTFLYYQMFQYAF